MPIKVLIVDDSLFMRVLLSDMLNSDPEIEVIDTAKDGIEAVKKIPKGKPDCITLDLAMPGWDGLTTLKHIMDEYPTPVVIISAYSKKDADITMKCLHAGAVGFVLKPSGELSLDIGEVKHQLVEEVKAASKANVGKIKSIISQKPRKIRGGCTDKDNVIVIGASTGGPRALELILSCLPDDFSVPIIVAQHIPTSSFTQSLAEHLNRHCTLTVRVIENDEPLLRGTIYLIPSGFRMTLTQRGKQDVIITLSRDESEMVSPSINGTMEKAAYMYKGNTVGVILSGMGADGVEGMKAIKQAGGKTIVQDESSIIFGMPKAVIDAGYADTVLPASKIAGTLVEYIS